jgi:hypothetical protein
LPLLPPSPSGPQPRFLMVEFLVEEPPEPAPPFTVTGRVMAGTVRVGDTFTEAALDRARPVALRVVEVRRYGLALDEVETVHGAQLLLSGDGWEFVRTGVTLRHHE